jgi:ABC-type Fe3+ transport system substrate-binding protein
MDTGPLQKRAIEEYAAGKFDVDMAEGGYTAIVNLKGQKILAKFVSPHLSEFPDGVKDPEGYMVGDRETPLGIAWNTNKIPEAAGPKTYDDLLDSKWKGKLATNDSVQGVTYFGALPRLKGEDYVRRLAQQDITVYGGISSKAVGNLVVAGEAVSAFPNSVGQIAESRKNRAPIAWAGLDQAPTLFGNLAVFTKAARPHATALFADWILSEEGQKTMATTGEGATRKGVANAYGGYSSSRSM